MLVLGSKASIKAWSKKHYITMKLFYQRTPEWKSNRKVFLAEINLFAGIHNQNRAMFE